MTDVEKLSLGRSACVVATTFVLALALAACAPPDSERRIILVTFDSLRADQLAAYGAVDGPMPTLDRLAAESVLFEHAYSPAPLTFPALAGMLTGQVPSAVGVVDDLGSVLSTKHRRVASHLLAAGWATGAFVNAPFLDADSGVLEGFLHGYNPAAIDSASQAATHLFADAVHFLETYRKSPSFIWVHIFDTHFPYAGDAAGRYRDALSGADGALARFLDTLESKGLRGNTVLVVAADHGEGLGSASERTHGVFLSDETLRVPLFIHGSAGTTRRVTTPVGLVDLGPTLADLAGAGAYTEPGPLDGHSLGPYLQTSPPDDAAGTSRVIYAETLVPALDYLWAPRQRVLTAAGAVARKVGDKAPAGSTWEWPEWPVPSPSSGPADKSQTAFMSIASDIVDQIASGKPDAATTAAIKLVEAYPDVPMATRLLALAQQSAGDLDGAIDTLETRLGITPSADLAVALARLKEDAGRPAAAAWAAAAATAPGRPRFHLHHAGSLLAANNTEGAIAAAQATLKADPKSAALNAALGRIYQIAGQPTESVRMFATAIQLSPGSSLYHRSSAAAVQTLGNIEGALTMLDQARRIDAADRLIHRDIGDVHAARDDLVKAAASYRASLPPDTAEVEIKLSLAENLLRMGQIDEAVEIVNLILAADPGNAHGHYTRAQVALREDDDDMAEKEFLESLRTGGEQPAVYYGLARLALRRADETQALAYLDRVFAANDITLRRIIRQDALLNAPERSVEVRRALQRYLIGRPPAAEPSS